MDNVLSLVWTPRGNRSIIASPEGVRWDLERHGRVLRSLTICSGFGVLRDALRLAREGTGSTTRIGLVDSLEPHDHVVFVNGETLAFPLASIVIRARHKRSAVLVTAAEFDALERALVALEGNGNV
jgi:hypothetical protein